MNVEDIMERVSDTLSPDTTIREAVTRMRMAVRLEEQGIVGVKGMIVTDRPAHPVGMLSMIDILRAILPWYIETDRIGGFTWDGMLEAMARRVADKQVDEVMNRELVSVRPDTPLMECAELMVKHNFQRLPVIDHDGKLVGIVYLRDLYHAISRAFAGEDK